MAEPSAKRARMEELEDESECALMDESEDEAMPVNSFGYGDAWVLSPF